MSPTVNKYSEFINEIQQNETTNEPLELTSNFTSFLNIFKTLIGLATISMPYCMKLTGFLLTILLIIFVCIINWASIYFFDKILSENKKDHLGLREFLKEINYIKMSYFYDIMTIILTIGVGINYFVFSIEFLSRILKEMNLNFLRIYLAVILFLLVSIICLLRNFNNIGKISFIGFGIFLICYILSYAISIQKNINSKRVNFKYNYFNFIQIPQVMGIIFFSLECIPNLFYIRKSMKNKDNFMKNVTIVLILGPFLFSLLGILGYFGFQNKTLSNILFNISDYKFYFYYLEFFFVLQIIFTYPLQLFPVYSIIESFNFIKYLLSKCPLNFLHNHSIPITVNFFICLTAFLVRDFAFIYNFTGSISGMSLQVLVPGIVFLMYKPRNLLVKIFIMLLMLICIFISIMAIYVSTRLFFLNRNKYH